MPVNKLTRVNDAYSILREEILQNHLPPGYQAPEPEIALRLGMSRTPIREALIRLEADGLVELIPRRGVRVLPINADDMKEIYEILTALEPYAAASLATRKPGKAELKPLAKATDDMEAALERGNLDHWAKADDEFHRHLLELHGNRRLKNFVGLLFDQAHRARMITIRLREKPVKSTSEHREILEKLTVGDAAGVQRIFHDHRKRAARELLNILESYKFSRL